MPITRKAPIPAGKNASTPVVWCGEVEEHKLACKLSGDWVTRRVANVDRDMRMLEGRSDFSHLELDLSGLRHIDTAGAWLVERLIVAVRDRGARLELTGVGRNAEILLGAVDEASRRQVGEAEKKVRTWLVVDLLEAIGRGVVNMWDDFLLAMHILGATIRGAQLKLGRGYAVNPAAIVSHIDRMGVGAIGVIVLMSAIVGAIIAQQGAFQLRYFGAEIFTVDLVGILVLRELGVLMTAIMLAGRTGSAITAEIGAMKMREEVDALTVIGLNPVGVLVFPRLLALLIALPCLTILADFAALGGAIRRGMVLFRHHAGGLHRPAAHRHRP